MTATWLQRCVQTLACQMATSHVLLWAPPGCCCTNGWAKKLDGFDMVMRFNQAPLEGFEAVVGSNTQIRIVATEATKRAMYCQSKLAANESVCPDYGMILTCFWQSDIDAWQDECGDVTKPILSGNSIKDSPVTKALTPMLQNSMSGATGIALALMLCPRGVDVYGFTHAGNIQYSNQVPYHYYDERRAPSPLGRVSLPATAQLLSDFAAGEGKGCVRLDTPSRLLERWNHSQGGYKGDGVVDPYVDPHLGACPAPPKTGILAWVSTHCDWCLSPGPIPIGIGLGLLLSSCLIVVIVILACRSCRKGGGESDAKAAESQALLGGSTP
mmetsp:Transcript_7290/g.15757  ORF Transcript_7290/g.15757 Transcript_7290/m.15757 type:complete len:327 (-) Transcript_7290:44-1024(-)